MDNAKPGDLKVEKWNEEKDGKLSESSLEQKLRRQGYKFIRYDFPPGMHFPDHTHGRHSERTDEVLYVWTDRYSWPRGHDSGASGQSS